MYSNAKAANTDQENSTETRAERIARYKEQRRKQLNAQYAGAKEQNGGANKVPTSSNNGVNSRRESNVSVVNESPIRTTRTSRLRAAAAAAAASLSGTSSNGSSEYLGHSTSPSPRLETTSSKEKSPVASRLEKDKSAKRKSNLNRSICSEETADHNDDKSRRRRRRFFPPDVFNITTTTTSTNQQLISSIHPIESPQSTSLSSLLSTNNSLLSNLPKTTTSSPSSHLASPIAVATAIAVSIASLDCLKRINNERNDPQQPIVSPCGSMKQQESNGNISDRQKSNIGPSCNKNMGGVIGSNGKGDLNRMGAIKKTGTAENRRISVVSAKGSAKVKSFGIGVAATSSPRYSEERNLLQQTSSSSNKENIRSRRPNKPQEPLGRRLDQLTALTQETLAKVKSLESTTAQGTYSRLLSRSRSTSTEPQQKVVNKTIRPTKKSPVNQAVLEQAVPVSILKRKVSQEECKSLQTPPVTFSPSVIDPPVTTSKRQGILKKRRSLDESQVMRHRSCSPDKSDSRSILKNQKRRSSLEEIAHRVNSPETGIPGILKRKTLKMNDYDDLMDNPSLNSPQSILKRKSGASSAGSTQDRYVPHVSIATAVILAAADGAEMILNDTEHVKPILKKKSFSEECGSSGIEVIGSYGDGLKPILKKKSSTDTDECSEDRPKRPILKLRSFQQDSQEYYDCTKSRSSLNNDSGSECDVKPILKQADQYKPRLSFCEGTSEQLNANLEQMAGARMDSYDSSSDCEFKPILKQSSKEQKPRLSFCNSGSDFTGDQPLSDQQRDRMNFSRRNSAANRRSNTICATTDFSFVDKRVMDKETDRELQKPRTLSVLELVKSFETTGASSGAIPKKSSLKRHSSERFKTQPITMHELQASGHISNNLSPTPTFLQPDSPLSPVNQNFHSLFNLQTNEQQQEQSPINLQPTCTKNLAQSKSDTELLLSLPSANSSLINNNKSTSSELYSTATVTCIQQDTTISASISCVSERGGIMSSDSAFQSLGDGLELVDESSDSEVEVKKKGDGEGVALARFGGVIRVMPPTPPGAVMVLNRRHLKGKSCRSRKIEDSSSRFLTQPVTTEEVAEAAKLGEKATNSEDSESSPTNENIKPILLLKPIPFKLPALPKDTTNQKLSCSFVDQQTIACDEGISSDSGSDSEQTRSANRVARRNARESQIKSKLLNSSLESNSDESSGGKEIQRIISKEAMAAVKKRRENLIFKSKSHAALPSSPQALTKLHFGRKQEDLDDSSLASEPNAVERSSNSLIYRSVTQSHLALKVIAQVIITGCDVKMAVYENNNYNPMWQYFISFVVGESSFYQ